MKITPEHYEHLKAAIAEVNRAQSIKEYREGNPSLSEQRVRWDYLWFARQSRWICDNIYPYANDEHIDTALRNIVAELEAK